MSEEINLTHIEVATPFIGWRVSTFGGMLADQSFDPTVPLRVFLSPS